MDDDIDTIFQRHGTDKSSKHHWYSRQYASVLASLRDKPIRYLEIGVQTGASLRAMREVFPRATAIVGVDIDPRCRAHADSAQNIVVEIGDATNAGFLADVYAKHGPFDVILDDGDHRCSFVIATFEALFPRDAALTDGGIYIVEDTHIYATRPYNNLSDTNHLQYFQQYIPSLNLAGPPSLVADPFKVCRSDVVSPIVRAVDRVDFGCGFVVIHKRVRSHWPLTPS